MMRQADLFANLDMARDSRDNALDRVGKNAGDDFKTQIFRLIQTLLPGWEGTGEDLRLEAARQGIPPPHHHNAWGAVISAAVKAGMLQDTKTLRNMRTEKSHARRSPVWRRP